MLSTIPFSGFYDTVHDNAITGCIEQMFTDSNGCETPYTAALQSEYFNSCHFHGVYTKYAQAYGKCFAETFKVACTFESMSSPREYNFTTDRIFVELSEDEARRIVARVDSEVLQALASENLTSRSGFISGYCPDVESWGDVSGWDHNQLGLLLTALANQEYTNSDQFDPQEEYYLMEDYICNGYMDEWLYEATPAAARLWVINDYLQIRSERI